MKSLLTSISNREKCYMAVGGLLLVLIIGYFMFYEPLSKERQRLRTRLQSLNADLQWMQQAQRRLAIRPTGQDVSVNGEALLIVIDRTIRAAGLKQQLKRVQPDGDDRIQLWFEQAPFAALVRWLDILQHQHGILVNSASVDRQSFAVVSAKLELMLKTR